MDEGQPEHAPFIDKKHGALAKSAEADIPAVTGNGGPYARFDQFLDFIDGFRVGRIEKLIGLFAAGVA